MALVLFLRFAVGTGTSNEISLTQFRHDIQHGRVQVAKLGVGVARPQGLQVRAQVIGPPPRQANSS